MAGYDDTKQKIIDTLMGRPNGTEIQPENHQDYALNMLDYIRSLELATTSTLIGVAYADTVPIQPDDGLHSRCSARPNCYLLKLPRLSRTFNPDNYGRNGRVFGYITMEYAILVIPSYSNEYNKRC